MNTKTFLLGLLCLVITACGPKNTDIEESFGHAIDKKVITNRNFSIVELRYSSGTQSVEKLEEVIEKLYPDFIKNDEPSDINKGIWESMTDGLNVTIKTKYLSKDKLSEISIFTGDSALIVQLVDKRL